MATKLYSKNIQLNNKSHQLSADGKNVNGLLHYLKTYSKENDMRISVFINEKHHIKQQVFFMEFFY